MDEIWKDINDYIGLYQVSNLGKVKSLKWGKERILKLKKNKDGYLIVCLYKNNKKYWKKVHRLIAETFIPNPNNLPQVNHINEDKTDNRVENLEYCDCKYNCNYGTRNQRRAKTQSKTIIQYDLKGNYITEYDSLNEINRQLGFSIGNISDCCNGKHKQVYGSIWRYKNGEQE